VSLLFSFPALSNLFVSSEGGDETTFVIARAGKSVRLARQGARSLRLIRLLRLVQLVRCYKFFHKMFTRRVLAQVNFPLFNAMTSFHAVKHAAL
jgi:hypothetical protein